MNAPLAASVRVPSARTSGVVTLGALRPLVAIMADAGLEATRVLEGAGLPADLFARDDSHLVDLAGYFRICEQMALQGGDESCHVSLRPLIAGTSRLVQERLLGCTTLAQVLDVLAQSYNIIHGGQYNRVLRRGRSTSYQIDDTHFPYAIGHDDPFVIFSLECLLVYVHVLLVSLAPEAEGLKLRQIRTRGDGPVASRSHLAFLGVPVQRRSPLFALDYSGQADSVTVDPARSPVITARTIYGGVADMLERMGPPPAEGDLVSRVIRALDHGQHDQLAVARQLGLSVASLRRGLTAEGTSFRMLRAARLEEAARSALANGMSMADIADMLSFSDVRSFSRAFRQWTGCSPGSVRSRAL